MFRSLRVLALTLAGAAALAAPAGASVGPGDIPLYDVHYYSDATYTQMVGWQTGFCNWNNPAMLGPVQGVETAYDQQVQVGICRDGAAIYW
ncbi:MAG: hypothetical protein K0M78_00220, partial [Brevundimonas sp.]|nr:hypothetical protein [Brevundimonas sp.]